MGDQDIGERITKLRNRRGLSREKLSSLAGISVGVIKKLEHGGTARMESYNRLARALGVRTVWFTGGTQAPPPDWSVRREQLTHAENAFRRILTPGWWSAPAIEGKEEPDLQAAIRASQEMRQAYLDSKYSDVSRIGPPVLSSLTAYDETEAQKERALLLDITGRYLARQQSYDLAWTALSQALTVAETTGDPEIVSQVQSGQALCLIRSGNFNEVEHVCSRLALQLEPRVSSASDKELAAWGRALNWAAAAAARNAREKEATEYTALAKAASARLTAEVAGHTTFGPGAVAVQEVENALLADRPDEALAVNVPLGQLNQAKRNTVLLDQALAAHRTGNRDRVTSTLVRIQHESPEWLIYSSRPRAAVREIVSGWNALLPESTRRIADLIEVPLSHQD